MTARMVYAPHLGHEVPLGGRRTPKVPHHGLRMAHVLRSSEMPAPPDRTSYSSSAAAQAILARMFLNDTKSCCVIASRGHRIGLLTAAAGDPFAYTDDQIIAEYERVGDYNPADPSTDNGCDMVVAANDAVQVGYADGNRDLGWVFVEAADKLQVMRSFYLLENGDLGMALPDSALDPFPTPGSTWNMSGPPNPRNGHCVEIVDYDVDRGVLVATWGMTLWLPWEALGEFGTQDNGGELIAHMNPDQLSKAAGIAPNGFDWATVVTYFDHDFGGNVTLPSGTPNSTGAPTLAQVQSWASSGIAAGHALMARGTAVKLAAQGLAERWPR